MKWVAGRRITRSLAVVVAVAAVLPTYPIWGADEEVNRWEGAIREFEAADAQSPPPKGGVLFLGSSSIRRWDLSQSFPGRGYINRGFGGSQIADATHFVDRIVLPYRPRTIVLYAGDNDIAAGKSPSRVADDFRAFVATVHAELPRTRIVFIAIKPSIRRWQLVDKLRQANREIARSIQNDPRLVLVDVDQPMLDGDGKPRRELFAQDGLHLSAEGYKLWALLLAPHLASDQQTASLILYNGKIVTVDPQDRIAQAIAIRGDRIIRVGRNEEVLALAAKDARRIDLDGRTVLPGLIDSHTHPSGASMHEFDHAVPEMLTITDVLDYLRSRTQVVPQGQWITVRQVFITRLREQRFPTKAELDSVAPRHPVVFSTGPDAVANSLALKLSGIDRDFQVVGAGSIEKDPQSGEATGMLRGGTQRYLKKKPSGRTPTENDYTARLIQLFADYNSVGLTTVADRNGSAAAIARYERIYRDDRLSVRLAISHGVGNRGSVESIQDQIRKVARHPLRRDDPMLKIVGVKTFLDGGMLTGSAYMRQPWGVSRIYSIDDPRYRGVRFIEQEKLVPIVRTTVESGLQFTAHSVGDGAVHALLKAYEEVDRTTPIRATRPCITHSNFMSRQAVEKMVALGVVCDVQPAWLYLDARTLTAQFGYDRLRYFQPLATIFKLGAVAGGGSDHMQKIGSLRSVNPYNPFLGMWVTMTRRARWYDGALHAEESLSRRQAIRFYTINNAYLLFLEDKIGSLEAGKLADLIVLDRDILSCPLDDVKDTQVARTYLNGRLIYSRE